MNPRRVSQCYGRDLCGALRGQRARSARWAGRPGHGRRSFFGPYDAMKAAFSVMRDKRYGRIISLCSLNGVNAHIGSVEYNAAKEAMRTLTRTAAREWAATGIVAPMGRMGDPCDDIAPVAVFLASEGACYLTGNTLFVDGGSHINGSAWAPELPA